MEGQIIVPINITYGKDEGISIETNDVPLSMILESLNTFTKFIATQLVEEAKEEVKEEGFERYLDGRLKVDREILNKLLNK